VRAAPVVLATRSAGKLRELRPLFAAAGIDVIDLETAGVPHSDGEDAVEAHETFEENALAKARYFRERTGRAVVADDSGLEVDVLAAAPGVRSKRWSGRADLVGQALDDANNAKLVESLRGVERPRARYVCVAAYCDGDGELVARGETSGEIILEPRGTDGFGYDPHFLSHDLRRTFGEADRDTKEAVSHRGRAFRALIERLGVER